MTFWYTARGTFDKFSNEDGISWDKYLQWSKLIHLTELVSLDNMLNEILVEPDYDNAEDWNCIITDDKWQTGFFATADYVIKRAKPKDRFNFLTVIAKPTEDCKNVKLSDYDFMGYELLDKEYGTSVLTNCTGLNEGVLPGDLNIFGLIDNFEKAYDIKNRILENNPEQHHADTNVIAVWRHKIIGRQK